MVMKTCNKCNRELVLDMFNKRSAKCKQCQKIYDKQVRLSKPEYFKAKMKEWWINNPEYIKQYQNSIEPGVYMIKNLITGKRYVGQSTKPYTRRVSHFSIFKNLNDKTSNPNLQIEIKQYGPKSFVFGIIEYCEPEQLLERERYYINQIQPEYNLLK